MKKEPEMKLTRGSEYRIYSLGSRERMLESQGVFEGYISIGIDEVGMILTINKKNGDMSQKKRIIPLHSILAIDILDAKPHDKKDDDQEIPNYVG
jgi:hypothetical protein